MSRIRWTLLLVALVAMLLAGQSAAAPPPWANAKPRRTTTTAVTTTTSTTTTTLPETTTTAAPTTTTVAGCTPGTPITITVGGIYSGCYQSDDPATPAVRVQTTAPVTLSHATVRHAGVGVYGILNGLQLTVQDSTFLRHTGPTGLEDTRAIKAGDAASLVVEYNRFTDGGGIQWNNDATAGATTGRIRFNDAVNIGRAQPTTLVQFFQAIHVTLGGMEVAWNKVTNTSGQSDVEDNISLYDTSGTTATPIDVHHNLIDGAYPLTPNGGYTGGGIMSGDGGGSFALVHDNTVVSTTNYGVSAAGGGNNTLANNLLVNDGLGSDGSTVFPSDFGQAVTILSGTTNAGTGNSYNWRRSPSDPNQYECWQPQFCSGNVQVATTEQQARDAWEASRIASGVTIGPRA
jgi:hypothetical protein